MLNALHDILPSLDLVGNVFVEDASSDNNLDDGGVDAMDARVQIIPYADDHGDNLEEEDVKCMVLVLDRSIGGCW